MGMGLFDLLQSYRWIMLFISIFLTLFCEVVSIQSLEINDSKRQQTNQSTRGSASSELTWDELTAVLKSKTTFDSRTLDLTRVMSTVNITHECRQSLKKFVTSLENGETWAVKMADANGKLPSGILEGRLVSLGTFDECLKIRMGSPELFRGQYCLLAMQTPLLADLYDNEALRNEGYEDTNEKPHKWVKDFMERSGLNLTLMSFFAGTCVPSTCSGEDVNAIAAHVAKPFGLEVPTCDCQKEEQEIWSRADIVAMSFIAFIAVLCFLGTVNDIVGRCLPENQQCPKYSLLNCLREFSVPHNTAKLFDESVRSFACLDGLRVISFVLILTGHASMFASMFNPSRNNFDRTNGWSSYLRAAIIVDGFYFPVETFFCISGFLLVTATWKRLEQSDGKFIILKFMLNKYLRLTPPHAFAVSVFILTYKFGSGPLRNYSMLSQYEACQTIWWHNFLYINNCFDGQTCFDTTWFLSALMQCHLIGVIILCISYRWPIKGIILSFLTVVGTLSYLAWVSILRNDPLPNSFYFTNISFREDFIDNVHKRTYVHVCSYIIGMAFGYMNLKQKTFFQTKLKYVGWFVATVLGLYAVCGRYCFPEEKAAVLVYHIFNRAVWATSLCWIIYACCSGHAGVVDRFLSWQGFAVFSKISYLAYLLHVPLLCLVQISKREATASGDFDFVLNVLGYTAATYIVSVVAYVTVELPFGTMSVQIFKRLNAFKSAPPEKTPLSKLPEDSNK